MLNMITVGKQFPASMVFTLASKNSWNCLSVLFLIIKFLLHLYLWIYQLLMSVQKSDMLGIMTSKNVSLSFTGIREEEIIQKKIDEVASL